MHTNLPTGTGAKFRSPVLRNFLYGLFTTLFTTQALATTYYVSPSGNDSNTGTSKHAPWKTLAKVNAMNLLPGDTVLLEGGHAHHGSLNFNSSDGNNSLMPVVVSSYGTPAATISAGTGNGIYIYNSQGFAFSDLTLAGSGMNTNLKDGVLLYTDLPGTVKPSNISFDNIEICGFGKTGLTFGSWNGNMGFNDLRINRLRVHDVLMNGITSYGFTSPSHTGWSHTNVRISNCEIYNVPGYADPKNHKGSGIMLAQVDNAVIEYCVAHHNGTANIACGGPGGIWAYDSNRLTIQYCESYSNSAGKGCDGLGFDLDGGVTNSIIQYCYSHDNDGAGFLLGQYENARPWKNNIVRFNISVNDGRTNSGGITLFKGAGTEMYNIDIYHNTVYYTKPVSNSGAGAFTMIDWYTGIDSVRVLNNIFQTEGGTPLVLIPAGYSAMMAGNQYWPGSGNFIIYDSNTQYTSLNAWRNGTGKESVNNAPTGITADPYLSGAGQAPVLWPAAPGMLTAYKPSVTSPGINAALTLTAFGIAAGSTDFYASIFPSGPRADIGAGEFYFAPPTPTVPTGPAVPGLPPGTTSTSPVLPDVTTTSTTPVPTAIAETTFAGKLVIYPNPLVRGTILHLDGVQADDEITVWSVAGIPVARATGAGSIPTHQFASGLYIVMVRGNGRTESLKLIVR